MQLEHQSDFYHYMRTIGGIGEHAAHDYISRLRFLAKHHNIDSSLTEDRISQILAVEETLMQFRDKYNSKSALRDFKSGLKKFLEFINSNYSETTSGQEDEQEKTILESDLSETEKIALIKARKGQGLFRQRLFDYWHGCALTDCQLSDILVASHIKPWRVSNNAERLNPYNGLLLLPNYDKLFDLGYITFGENGHIKISQLIPSNEIEKMSINPNISLTKLEETHREFLHYHQQNVFIP